MAVSARAPVATTVAAVVVTHDTRDELLDCVRSLRDAGVDEIVVVDSGSRDGTVGAVRRHDPSVEVLALGNVGFGRAANAGVARTRTPYVLVLNADARVTSGLDALVETLEAAPDVAAVGPRVRYPDGRPQASARRLPSAADAVGHAVLGPWWPGNPFSRRYLMADADPTSARDVDWLSGCAVLVRRRAFEGVGGFDPAYFMYVEDVDLGWRLRRAGWRLRYEPGGEVAHRVGASTSRRRIRMLIAHARGLDRFYGRLHPEGAGRALRPLVRVGLVAWVAVAAVRGRPRRSSAMS